MSLVWKRIFSTIAEGLVWSLSAILILWLTFPSDYLTVSPSETFARRWDGSCSGWTKDLACLHIAGDLLTWIVYIIITFAILRLHPVMQRLPSSRITIWLIVLIFSTCGATHLFETYTSFYPVYWFTGIFKFTAAIIGLIGSVLIAHNLVVVSGVVEREQMKLRKFEKQFIEQTGVWSDDILKGDV